MATVKFNLKLPSSLHKPLLDVLYPPRCAYCDADLPSAAGPMFCDACRRNLALAAIPRCLRCGAARPASRSEREGMPQPAPADGCRRCRGRDFAFQGVACLGVYEGELQAAVLRTKHHQQDRLTRQLAELLWDCRADEIRAFQAEVVAAVPMHWTRRIHRGANGPDAIAEVLAARLGVPAVPLLRRVRRTQRQGSLPRVERLRNMKNAFGARRRCRCAGARVLLADDIMTTGATCGEAARLLLRMGAAAVAVAVLARAEGPD